MPFPGVFVHVNVTNSTGIQAAIHYTIHTSHTSQIEMIKITKMRILAWNELKLICDSK